ncbi:MAG TPA: hypothetical protein P5239_06040, partial [Victivallales bacterium]|nr:hypothetical protein [Victivallales bacterium]
MKTLLQITPAMMLTVCFSINVFSEENLPENIPIAQVGEDFISAPLYMADGGVASGFFNEIIETEGMNKSDESIEKLKSIASKLLIRDAIIAYIEKKLKLNEALIPEAELREYVIKNKMDKNEIYRSDYTYYKGLVDAYDYLEANKEKPNVIREAYDKFLAERWEKIKRRKGRASSFDVWKGYAEATLRGDMFFKKEHLFQFKYYDAVMKKKITPEVIAKTREELLRDPDKKSFYLLRLIARTDDKVEKYIKENYEKSNRDLKLEKNIIDRWYLKELNKVNCKLLIDKFGNLEEIIS